MAKNDLTKVAETALTDELASELLSGIAESRQTTILSGGVPFLRLLKSGEWVFGQANEPVQEGSQWAVNIMTLGHGWACWIDSELRGEAMESMARPKPARPPSIDGVPYKEQRAFSVKCLTGDDAGVEALYKTTSDGGLKAVDKLLIAVQTRLQTHRGFPFPVLELGDEYYAHPKYGRIYKPILQIVGWANDRGQIEGKATATPVASEPEPTPPKPRKPPLRAVPETAPQAPVEPPAPVSTQQAHVGQRRRPAAR